MANRLAKATSPYLLQHAENPVDWWEWGPEAFAEAKRRDAPILLSVGYAACHWCHVMAHESFEDPATAQVMNANFVNIKVDREERPDVDAVYMDATTAMTGRGGWPMTVFCTPDGKPFYCGTYFPPRPTSGMPAFRQVLTAVADTWRTRRDDVERTGGEIASRLAAERPLLGRTGAIVDSALPTAAVSRLSGEFDPMRAGFGGAPKFPPSMVLEFLLRHWARTGDTSSLSMAEATCEAMLRGGIYDQLAGGFARYSVDATWTVPHFEKMLYDNALLLRVYAHLWRATSSEWSARAAVETGEFLLRELRTPEGGFASALDADSEGREGAFYVWTPAQLMAVLGPEDGRWAAELLSVTEGGTFEHGSSVLQLREDADDRDRWRTVRDRLLAARSQRPRPARDDKVVAAWNGLAIAALAESGALLGRPEFLAAATDAAGLQVRVHLSDGRIARASRDGVAGRHPGVLEDYGDLAEGLLTLFAVTGEPLWFDVAGRLLSTVLDRFGDGRGGFFDTADDAERLLRRPQDPTDNATPSGTSSAAGALLTYSAYTGERRWREAAEAALAPVAVLGEKVPRFAGWGLAVAEALLDGPREVAIVGRAADERTADLRRTALLGTAPGAALAVGDPAGGMSDVPLLRDRPLRGDAPAAYVCRNFVCERPVTDPAELAPLVGAVRLR